MQISYLIRMVWAMSSLSKMLLILTQIVTETMFINVTIVQAVDFMWPVNMICVICTNHAVFIGYFSRLLILFFSVRCFVGLLVCWQKFQGLLHINICEIMGHTSARMFNAPVALCKICTIQVLSKTTCHFVLLVPLRHQGPVHLLPWPHL